MMRLLFFIALFPFFLNAQVTTVQGKLLDEETGFPIVHAHLFIEGSTVGTISNEEGEFILNVALKNKASLKISSIGYASKIIQIINGKNQNHLEIKLKAISVELDEVSVKSKLKSPEEIIKEAVLRIPQNYHTNEHVITGYHRESESSKEGELLYIIESVLQAKMPKLNSKDSVDVVLLKSRKKEVGNLKKLKIDYKRGGVYPNLLSPIVKLRGPMKSKKMRKYSYSIEGYSKFNDKVVVIISFTNSKNKPRFGKFIIDLESYAFIRYESTQISRPGSFLGTWKWTSKQHIYEFTEDSNKTWYLNSGIFIGKWIKKKNKREFITKDFYVTTEFSKNTNLSKSGKRFYLNQELYEEVSSEDFNSNFWDTLNYIKLNKEEERTIRGVTIKEKKQ